MIRTLIISLITFQKQKIKSHNLIKKIKTKIKNIIPFVTISLRIGFEFRPKKKYLHQLTS